MEKLIETRSLNLFPEMEARAAEDEEFIRITGYGAVFQRKYDVYGFKERIAPGAFAKTLAEKPDVRGMFNHDPSFLLGRTKSGTMDVAEDKKGLAYEIRADKLDPQAQSVARKIARGDVDGSSMAFFVRNEEWESDADGRPKLRTITEIELIETGPVTMPASPSTTAKIQRSLEETGIDFDALTGFAVKRRAGFRLLMAEEDLIARTIDRLERLKADPESVIGTSLSPVEAQKYSEAAWALRSRVVISH
jgi:HK97 family phage prohead protease